ncbi:unnamed protein product [Heterobilharzia americana]|nr:unnamed protein product [Heterobilharzia americana]CAH8579840.1 unnamed protein product [Heterobilharzia americana]
MKTSQIMLVTNILCLLLLRSTNAYAVLEGKKIVKNVYTKGQPTVLQATAGFISSPHSTEELNNINHTNTNNGNGFSTIHHVPQDSTNNYVLPNFITGAHLVPADLLLTDTDDQNSTQWSFSTTFVPLDTRKFDNKTDEDTIMKSKLSEQQDQREEMHSFGGGNQRAFIENHLPEMPPAYPYDNEYYLPEEMRKYQVVISSDMDLPYSMDQPNDGINGAARSSWPYNKDYSHYFENEVQFKQGLLTDQQMKEEARPVYHSPVRWAIRDIASRGQPRHIACSQPLDRGVGSNELSSWYYDSKDGRCRWFGYRGYGGNANRFYSRTACEELCVRDNQNMCEFAKCPKSITSCELVGDDSCKVYKQQHSKPWEAECPPDQPVCITKRNTRMAPDIEFENVPSECRQSPDPGSCQVKNPSQNFFYDIESNDCISFYFHECGGNDNRFLTKSDCMSHCSP